MVRQLITAKDGKPIVDLRRTPHCYRAPKDGAADGAEGQDTVKAKAGAKPAADTKAEKETGPMATAPPKADPRKFYGQGSLHPLSGGLKADGSYDMRTVIGRAAAGIQPGFNAGGDYDLRTNIGRAAMGIQPGFRANGDYDMRTNIGRAAMGVQHGFRLDGGYDLRTTVGRAAAGKAPRGKR